MIRMDVNSQPLSKVVTSFGQQRSKNTSMAWKVDFFLKDWMDL